MFESAIISGASILATLILWLAYSQLSTMRKRNSLAVVPSGSRMPSLIYFMRDRSSACAIQDQHLQMLEGISDVRYRQINIDYDRNIAERFGISTVPTILILDQGGIIKYANYGVADLTRLTQQLEGLK